MTVLQAVILGIVQGLTEFIPVSSSAHLVLVPWWLGWQFETDAAFAFDVLVQLGTLVGVIAFFGSDLVTMIREAWRAIRGGRPLATPEARQAWLLVAATIPAVVAGLLLKDSVEEAFSNPVSTSVELMITAAFLWLAERTSRSGRSVETMTWIESLGIGLAQATAIFPGISRSGATMAAGRALGFDRSQAARFSFLMSVPVMLGAGLVASVDFFSIGNPAAFAAPLVVGFIAAAIVGYLSVRWMMAFVSRHPLTLFAVYCLLVGLASLAAALLRA
jgi:undecaprenyl-diphosphatase